MPPGSAPGWEGAGQAELGQWQEAWGGGIQEAERLPCLRKTLSLILTPAAGSAD